MINLPAASDANPLLDMRDFAFLTVAEVSAVMRVSKMTVYRMVHTGELPAVRVGRTFRINAQVVRDYLTGADVQTGGEAS